jgi:putative addiction module killer protein
MVEILKTQIFTKWFEGLRDRQAQQMIQAKIDYLTVGGMGKAKRLTSDISELKIDHGPGYRVYFTQRGPVVVILLCGGDKRTQDSDIKRAGKLAAALEMTHGK